MLKLIKKIKRILSMPVPLDIIGIGFIPADVFVKFGYIIILFIFIVVLIVLSLCGI